MITPTQCGEAVVARVAEYLGEIGQKAGALTGLARARLDSAAYSSRPVPRDWVAPAATSSSGDWSSSGRPGWG